MHTKTLEGLVGARTNINLTDARMRVFRDARRRGDIAVMERAMEYVGKFADKAQEYKAEADEGMEEDAKEAREKAKQASEEAIQKRKEERKKLEERIAESKAADGTANAPADAAADTAVDAGADTITDSLEITETGKKLSKGHTNVEAPGFAPQMPGAIGEPVTYTKTAGVVSAQPSLNISISI